MLRAVSVILLALFLASFVLADNRAAPDTEQVLPAAVAQIAGECGDGPGSGGCNAMCAACSAFAANAVVQFPRVDFDGLPFMPASRFADPARAPDATPPKHLLA